MKKLAFLFILVFVGCIGVNKANPMTKKASKHIWWQDPVYADTPKKKNAWEKFIPVVKPVNEFDPWAADNLDRYSVSRVTTITKPSPPKKSGKNKRLLKNYLREFPDEKTRKDI